MEIIHYVLITMGAIIFISSLALVYKFGKNKGYYDGFEEGYTNCPHYTEEKIISMLAKSSTRRRGR